MAKRTITTWWILGAAALALAAVLIIADAVALAAHLTALRAAADQSLTPDDFSRLTVVVIVLGAGIAAIGIAAELVAWVGALANTHSLSERRWFIALLWSGVAGILTLPLFGLGALIAGSAMLAYLVGGPARLADRRPQEVSSSARPSIWSKPTILRWSTWGLVPMGAGAVVALVVSRLTNVGGPLEGHTWTALVLLMACVVAAVGGIIVESVAWWAAIFNARRLADKTWFNVLVWSGIVATLTMPLFGLGALIAAAVGIAYRSAAPDSTDINTPTTRAQAAAA